MNLYPPYLNLRNPLKITSEIGLILSRRLQPVPDLIREGQPTHAFLMLRKDESYRVMEDEEVIKKILKHPGLWDQKARPPPKANSPPMDPGYHIDYTDSRLPVSDNFLYAEGHVFSVMDPLYTDILPS